MKKSFAFALGATLAVVASAADFVDVYAGKTPGTRVDLLEKDWKHDFALTFEASFAKDAAPSVPVQVYFPRQPGDTPDRWTSIHFSLDFVFGPRTFDGVDREYCGTTWYAKEYFDYLPRPTDTWRRLAVVSHDGYTSFYLEHDGRLQRIHTCRYLAPFQVAGLKIGGERGAVLELTRGDDNKGKTIGGIRLKKPVAIPEDATTVGVWVKGNSSRGDVDFEIEDADGDIFHSTSRGWTRDWGEKMRLDFDGWRCVWMPLKNESPVRIYSAGMDITQLWRCSKYVKTRMRGTIKLKGVSFSWGDDIVYVNENRPVKNQSVRIGPCVAF